jgi:hypothetical protein
MVLARGRIEAVAAAMAALAALAALTPATLFLRARVVPGVVPAMLSRRLRGRDDGVVVWWSFC